MNPQIKQRIESVINNIEQLPSIPEVATRIINMVNDPEVSFKAIADEISKDQMITTNILKLCNSAYFSKGKEISSVDRAIVTLGLKEVKDAVILAATKIVLNKIIMGYDLAKGELWRHGLYVAVLAKKIALMKGKKDIADVAFTGGLIHDVGKTILALFVQGTFKEIMRTVEEKKIPFIAAEKDIMGFDHQEIGERILSKWKFPEVLKASVRHHHQPMSAPDEFRTVVSIVHVANSLCLMAGVGIGSDGLYHELVPEAIELTKLEPGELEMLFAGIPEMGEQAETLI
ncbi:MAG TPA: HDOD domain-containing protein [Spirochaetota bacterium]|nr:HDOD domain-containing protein [Spirochaetota bacterium]HNT09427.1 HDOD domain-containing protein [Spirochaetota bacterium]HNV45501.1 HDOD domain-containing protein [Spirochaetota bacterium]HOS38707.1 HDOD domain-containing protein [Spirochaetota bacterium]HPI21705.1 HDOD domain-containing protein [Spirochaetota bacterium]